MEDAIRQFLEFLERDRGSSQNTILAYRTDLRQFVSVVSIGSDQPFQVDDLSAEPISHYADWLESQGYRPATVSRKMAAVRSFLEYLRPRGFPDTGMYLDILQPPPSPRRDPVSLTEEEVTRLIDAPGKSDSAGALRDSAILSLLYETGFRAAELVDLNLSDVDVFNHLVYSPHDRKRSVRIEASIDPLSNYLHRGRPHLARDMVESRVFLNQRGQGLSRQGLWLVVKRWAAVAHLPAEVSPSTIRHSRARQLLASGKSKKEVQEFLGLSSPNAIRYHRKKDDRGREGLENAIFDNE
jgi:integrase/recombinase XerD